MELYVHLPFCARKCRYCDFASYAGCLSQIPAYIDAVLTEAAWEADTLAHPVMDTIFLGGGTPSLVPPEELTRLLRGLAALFPFANNVEFTTEANPGTVTQPWLSAAIACGINRLSLGMQALQPHLLQTLGSIHDFRQVEQSVHLAQAAGLRNLNLDLMFGLPGQTMEDWLATLDAACSLSPTHLSCYGLIPEDGTPLKNDLDMGILTLPDVDKERAMYDAAITCLAKLGFEQYEISNFALPGHACRHNLGYWRQTPYLGLGASASSMLCTDDARYSYIRRTNPASLANYFRMVKERHYALREEAPVSPADAQFETLMLGLRTTRGVQETAYRQMHGAPLSARYGRTLERLAAQGLLMHENGWWRLTRRGMDVQNAVLVELMED